MTTIVASVIAASLATALTIGLVRGEDALGGVLAPAATFTVMDQLVDFEFQNTPFEQALAKLGDACGIVVIIKPGVENRYPLTLKVSQMKLSEAIIWIASFSDTIIVYENGALVVKPNAP